MCDKHDSQTLVGGMHRPIGLGQMLCMSESHQSKQGPGIVDRTAAEAGSGWVDESITDC